MQFAYLNQDAPQYVFPFYIFLGYYILQYQISFTYYNVLMVTHHTSFSMTFLCETFPAFPKKHIFFVSGI